MAIADVTVVGGGIFGLSVAWECARRGARVLVTERDSIGAGSSGGIVGALAPHVPENWNAKKAFQLESLLLAEGFWAGVGAASDHDPGYARSGRVQMLADAGAVTLAKQRSQTAKDLWQGHAVWKVVPHPGDGWVPASPSGYVVEDTLSARLHPRQASHALVAAIRSRGGVVREGHSMSIADAATADQKAGPVLWATGVQGLKDLSADLGRALGGGVKGQSALFACDAQSRPQIFAEGVHIIPHADGTVAVGSTSERDYTGADTVDGQLEDLIAQARRLCPALRPALVVERWAGARPRSKSRAPMLGQWPGRPGHFVANGGFKIGFGMAPMVARVMADLMLDGQDTIPDGFRIEDSF
ncbi:MAG: FAD-binding oxidoreductase [Albidovulum sp.]